MKSMNNPTKVVTLQAIAGLAALAVFLWAVLFLPAWTLNYWQAWTYWIIFLAYATAISTYFLKKDLNLIEKRLKVASSEKESSQKLANSLISLFFILLILIPPIDHRFHWSSVPTFLVIAGDVFVPLGFLIVFLVFKENSFTSTTIEVNKDQKIVSTGPYSIVRHPMYSGALVMLLFTPLALGSFWGLFVFPPLLGVIAFRLLEEEKFLSKNLPRYEDYRKKVHNRLILHVW
jgi:protein-S-isoprenylcysteine O-methyltransferase Ste14